MVVGCRLELWERSVRAITVGTLESLAVINGWVNGKIGWSGHPISEAVLIP